ncbi:MAG: lipopolysaccharide biosynthesis protein [Nocardioidaceae bacterium]
MARSPAGVAPVSEAGPRDSGERIERLARDGLLALVGAGVSAVLNLVLVFVVIHAAGRYTAGVVFAATSLFLIAETASRVGCPTGLMYFLVRARTLGRPERLRGILRAGLVPVAVVSVLLSVALFALGSPLAHWLAPQRADAAVGPLRLLAVLIPAAALSDSLLYATRAFGSMRPLIFVERMGRPVLQVLFTFGVVLVGWRTAAGLSLAWALPYAVTSVVAVAWTLRLVRGIEHRAGVRAEHGPAPWAEFWRFTTPRALQSIVQIALQRLPIVLIAAILGPPAAAVYAAVTRFLVFGQLGSQAITAAVQPQLGALLVQDDHDGAQHVYQVSTCWLVLLCWPVYLGLAVFSRQIPQVFGRGYDSGTAVLLVLAGAMLFATGSGMVDSVLAMAGKTTWTLANATLALVVDVSLTVVLLPHVGIVGAAVAWAAAIVVNNALPLTQLALALQLHPFGRGTLTAMFIAAGWLGLLPLAAALAFGGTLQVLVTATAVGLVGYVLTAHRLRAVLELDALVKATRRRQGQPSPVLA